MEGLSNFYQDTFFSRGKLLIESIVTVFSLLLS
jgi:hypothetical protein